MKREDIKGKRIGVLGLGIEGFVSAAYLHKLGGLITVLDVKDRAEHNPETIANLGDLGIEFAFGSSYKDNLADFEVIVRSPGIKLSPEERELLVKKNILLTSQTQLFMEWSSAPIIGVTGTKGKGTTSSLIYEMIRASGKEVYLGGNIGLPPFSFLDKLDKKSFVVLELSSFQLMDFGNSTTDAKALTGKPHIAVMLMIVPEHLDYHTDVYEYIDAKRKLLRFQTAKDFAIVNRDYIASNESDIHTASEVYYVSRERENDEGSYVKDNAIWIRKHGKTQKIVDIDAIRLPGKHNIENVLAASMAASLTGVNKEYIVQAIQSFSGLEHRLELVREISGVSYYDDSFSTTPETAIAAIEAFTSPEILILGGSSKQSDFTELGKIISQRKNIKAIIGIGEEWERIKSEIRNSKSEFPMIEGADTMETVVQAASKIAVPGDVVILSPGCASFGMFKNYKERGEQFKKAVVSLLN